MKGQPITIFGNGKQTRCFGWVGDVVKGMVTLAGLPTAEGLVFNLGSDEEVTINQLALLVKEITGSESAIQYVTYDQAYGKDFEDMHRRVPDLTRVRHTIGYAPSKSLRELVEVVVDSMSEPRMSEPRAITSSETEPAIVLAASR